MKLTRLLIWLWLTCALAIPAQAQEATAPKKPQKVQPLFASEEIISIRFEGPLTDLVKKSARSTSPYKATMTVIGAGGIPGTPERHDVTLAARGNSRRTADICAFPPLRLRFAKKPKDGLFKGQKSLKLVTHCHRTERRKRFVQLEFAAYQMFNDLTEQSLRVRMARIDYVDTPSGDVIDARLGFFIEDMDAAAKRNGMKEIDIPRVTGTQLNLDIVARNMLFHYMIGNVDWSMLAGPKGSDCCHNTKLMGAQKTSTTGLIPVPYDFDQSGLVSPPGALLPEQIPIRNLRQRYYRGRCFQNEAVTRQAKLFVQKKAAILSRIDALPDVTDKNKANARSFLGDFFEIVESPAKFEKTVLGTCR